MVDFTNKNSTNYSIRGFNKCGASSSKSHKKTKFKSFPQVQSPFILRLCRKAWYVTRTEIQVQPTKQPLQFISLARISKVFGIV
jgi:hypothetical protein